MRAPPLLLLPFLLAGTAGMAGAARALPPCSVATAPQPTAGAQFGCSVATDGHVIASGANMDPGAGPAGAGAVYVLQSSGTVRLTAADAKAGDQLGFSVAVSGDTLAAGALFADAPGASAAGAVYIFLGSNGAWSAGSPQVKLTALDAARGDLFGQAVALSGDRIAVGAPDHAGAGGSLSGAVYLFHRSGGAWSLESEIADPDVAPFDGFGYALALDGDTLAVGAPFADGPGGSLGAVHVFVRGATGWTRQQRLTAGDGANGDELGVSMALASGTLVAGARRADVAGRRDAGAAYVFTLAGGTWAQSAKLTALVPAADDLFGGAVALSGRRIVIGARFHGEGAANAGAVYVFDAPGAAPLLLLGQPPEAGAQLGASAAAGGDTVVAGAFAADPGGKVDAGSILACPLPPPPPPLSVLSLTKTDGRSTYQPGQLLTYTLTVTNGGSAPVADVRVTDPDPLPGQPSQLVETRWCRGAGCTPTHPGDLADTVSLPVGTTVYTFVGLVRQDASGPLVNRACVTAPGGTAVCAADTDQRGSGPPVCAGATDLAVTQSAGPATACPGGTLTYTITVLNLGNCDANGARLSDTFPAALSGVTWTCVRSAGASCAPSGSGPIADTITLPPGGAVTYRATGTVNPNARPSFANQACVTPQAGRVDPVPGNDCATVAERVGGTSDLVITKTHDRPTVSPQTVTFTITVRNPGTCTVSGARVTDTFPATLTGVTWTCAASPGASCTAAGAGAIADAVVLPPGGSVTYTATGTVSPNASGAIANQACVAPPAGVNTPAPNCVTDPGPTVGGCGTADLAVSKTDGRETVARGDIPTYTVTVRNLGLCPVSGAKVTDTFPPALTGVTWTCAAAAGGACTPAGAGAIADTVTLPAGATVTYTATGTVSPNATGAVTNQACVAPPAGVADPVSGNDCATDTDVVLVADLAIAKTGPANAVPGQTIFYTLTVTNPGTAPVTGARVTDSFPLDLEQVQWCRGASCTPAPAGALDTLLDLAPGGTEVYKVQGIVRPAFTGTLSNTATVALPAPLVDPTPGDNSATAETMVMPAPGVTGFCDGIDGPFIEGGTITYTFVLRNGGPFAQADNPGNEFTDTLPASLTLLGTSASSGVASFAGNTVRWNGAIPVKGTVTITVTAMINPGTAGTTICNQGAFAFDADGDGINESNGLTDDPTLPGAADPCCFRVLTSFEIPALSPAMLLLLALLLAGLAVKALQR